MARRANEQSPFLISAALIVRDEESLLAECLESVRPLVDEIIVVDTGSKDRTVEIARAHGARVHVHEWRGDFAAARNESFDLASGEWILYIDADERLRPAPRTVLDVLSGKDDFACFRPRLHPRMGFTAYREYRLLRNHPRLRFQGVVHETCLPALRELEADGWKFGDIDLTIDHVGYERDQRSKHERYLPLLIEGITREPSRVYNWWHLGTVYAGLGDECRAEETWSLAVERIRTKPRAEPVDSLIYVELLMLRFDRGDDISELLDEARTLFPWSWSFVWIDACRRSRDGDYESAVGLFESLSSVDIDKLVDQGIAYEADIFGAKALDGLGTALLKLGRCAESADVFDRAFALAPERAEYRVKRDLARARTGFTSVRA